MQKQLTFLIFQISVSLLVCLILISVANKYQKIAYCFDITNIALYVKKLYFEDLEILKITELFKTYQKY